MVGGTLGGKVDGAVGGRVGGIVSVGEGVARMTVGVGATVGVAVAFMVACGVCDGVGTTCAVENGPRWAAYIAPTPSATTISSTSRPINSAERPPRFGGGAP
jgi:hypothetical protein